MIDNPRSPRVRAVAKLSKGRARRETGLFLIEGPQSVAEALAYHAERLLELYATDAALDRHPHIIEAAVAAGIDVEETSEQVLAAMADTVTPQGLVAVCRQLEQSVDEVLEAGPRLVALLHEIRDPGNAGTIIRAADAADADAVIFTGDSVDIYNPKVVRSTTGSLFHLPVIAEQDLTEVISRLSSAGLQVIAADVKGGDLLQAREAGVLAKPTAWLFGNEAHGLSDSTLALAGSALKVPLYGRAESMNLATAASVCLYESAFALRTGS
ncbi:TrmH family RNA methyltransferase [Ruicaihuangia caeni]|uniref:TrmH family RNA methyltransferase n=1 Tax=Ruicaihuangia caeni TaxID=3042517 RepID=UPI00338DA9CB